MSLTDKQENICPMEVGIKLPSLPGGFGNVIPRLRLALIVEATRCTASAPCWAISRPSP